MKTTEKCLTCKKEIPIIEWNNHRQKLFGGDKPIKNITEMVFTFYECPNCNTQFNYYPNMGLELNYGFKHMNKE